MKYASVRVEGTEYLIPEAWIIGYLSTDHSRTYQDAIETWHRQQQWHLRYVEEATQEQLRELGED